MDSIFLRRPGRPGLLFFWLCLVYVGFLCLYMGVL